MVKPLFVLFIALSLSGCLSMYQVPSSAKTAEFHLQSENDTPKGTTLSRGAYVWAFKDEQCTPSAYGVRTGVTFADENTISTAPTKIVANEKFAFTARYVEGRFAHHRSCSITAAFSPAQDHRYKAMLRVVGEVGACDLALYDITSGVEEAVSVSKPEHLCLTNGVQTTFNGQPIWTDVKVTVTTVHVPAKK